VVELCTAISVEVHSGITPTPGGMVMDDLYGNQSNEQAVLVPWRVGSERHLGIRRGSAVAVDDVSPPPY
jgi:hypothetical protein